MRVERGGDPVGDADVGVTYRMPAMGGMPEMRGDADIENAGGGHYVASFDLPMGGSWQIEVEVQAGDQTGRASLGLTVGTRGLTTQDASGGSSEPTAAPPVPSHAFSDAALGELRAALAPYEQIRATLAGDATAGLGPAATRVATALDAAHGDEGVPASVASVLESGATAARQLAEERDLEGARQRFGEISGALVAAAEADPRLQQGLHVFRCPMAQGFQKWVQPSGTLENPYMGSRMLTCGSESDWTVGAVQAPAPGGDDIAYYTCGMHPSVHQDGPGTCPICGMDLTPVTTEEVQTGVIRIDDERRQRIGLRTQAIGRRAMSTTFRAIGRVAYDESRLSDVNLRMSGWVQRLNVDEQGQRVRRGQVLFTLYSPELYAAQLDYLTALRSHAFGGAEGEESPVARAARRRLILLGMSDAQAAHIRTQGEATENVPITAPASGYVIEKDVVEGAQIQAGTRVYRIANLDEVWVEADVYENDMPNVHVGQDVTIALPNLPDRTFPGRVSFIYPYLDDHTRTTRVRVSLDNPDLTLRPDMYADVDFDVPLGEQLAVPAEAVIYTGPRRVVFVDLGEGRLRPKVVELGARAGDSYVVRSGLEPGDVVVTSGTFLVASESRLRSSLDAWGPTADEEQHASSAESGTAPPPAGAPSAPSQRSGRTRPAPARHEHGAPPRPAPAEDHAAHGAMHHQHGAAR